MSAPRRRHRGRWRVFLENGHVQRPGDLAVILVMVQDAEKRVADAHLDRGATRRLDHVPAISALS